MSNDTVSGQPVEKVDYSDMSTATAVASTVEPAATTDPVEADPAQGVIPDVGASMPSISIDSSILEKSRDIIARSEAEARERENKTPKIGVEKLDLYYGKFRALRDINMKIDEHKITALIGPSGCGKSTLLRTLNRMNDLVEGCHIEGTVTLDGDDIYGKSMDVNMLRKRVGMVFQKANPFPMSVYDNIAYGPRTHGVRGKAKLDEIVETALVKAAIWDELKDRLNKSALGLSGGQQQRLCIARALAVEPEVLLMDEATSALDPLSTGRIEELAVELKKDYTVVMVTHNMQQAARVSDMCAFFLLGDLVEYDSTERLFSMPQDKRTEDYITGRFG